MHVLRRQRTAPVGSGVAPMAMAPARPGVQCGRRALRLLVIPLAMVLLAACTANRPAADASDRRVTPQATSRSAPAPAPASRVPARHVTKVLTFIEENHSLAQMRSGMPYTYGLAEEYGYATHWNALRHPSLPNYLAMAGGSTYGIDDDDSPEEHPLSGPNVFGVAISAGKTAKTYQESMTQNCQLTDSGQYAVKHNPWAYFVDDRDNCNQFDVATGTAESGVLHDDIVAGALPNIGQVTPNLENDAHDGTLPTADAWIKQWMQLILASPDWKSGRLAVIITADEDDGSQGNTVLTVVIHPSQHHHVVDAELSHYSWTRLMTDLAGAHCLGEACSATDARAAFHLP
jgi:hypothetical protein